MRSSHRRKNSMTASLNLYQGRRSPGALQQPQSSSTSNMQPSDGRKSPVFLGQDQMRSPMGLPSGHRSPTDRRSPTSSLYQSGRRSPLNLNTHYGIDSDRKSPTGCSSQVLERRSPCTPIMEDRQFTTPFPSSGRKSPIGFSQGMITTIAITPTKSPTIPIPPITVSKPSETLAMVQKQMESNTRDQQSPPSLPSPPPVPPPKSTSPVPQEKKEKSSVMKDILAFVRKPSKKVGTRTSRFAAAFSRTESNSGIPLLRQSTFSSSPTPSSRAAKSAVTKQLSEVSLEPKMSSKFRSLASTTKISLRLRRTGEKKDKKSSGDEVSDVDSASESKSLIKDTKAEKKDKETALELENVRFEKVGDSYLKHERIREETLEESSPVKAPSTTEIVVDSLNIDSSTKNGLKSSNSEDEINSNNIRISVENLKRSLQNLLGHNREEKANHEGKDGNGNQIKASLEGNNESKDDEEGAVGMDTLKCGIQCPTFEIEPPSRRASFDPPRSPYLENLRSPGGDTTDPSRFDSAGESFEIVDTDRNRESSFEDRYSSMDTSFDISRYHSTSYEDQTSSFEMVESNERGEKKSSFDLRKSSIELVDVETFQRSTDGRKSSLETHFDYMKPNRSGRHYLKHSSGAQTRGKSSAIRSHFSHRPRSPLSQQTSSNYSSRDSYDSGSELIGLPYPRSPFQGHSHFHPPPVAAAATGKPCPAESSGRKSPFEGNKMHFPIPPRSPNEPRGFICTDQRCAAIFEPRPPRTASPYLSCSSGNEFEPPSPRRASSASPKHTFTFRIVMKKVESSPDNIGQRPRDRRSRDRTERHKRRDSRKHRLLDTSRNA